MRKTMSIDERIEKQTKAVEKAKIKYDETVSELEKLVASREAARKEEILKAYGKSGKSFKEVMDFFNAR